VIGWLLDTNVVAELAATDQSGHLYRRPLDHMPETMDGQLPLPMPTACPVTLEALLEVGLAIHSAL